MEIFCGIDWAEDHHDVAVVDDKGRQLAKRRISDDLQGFTALTELLAGVARDHLQPDRFVAVDIAIETDRGLLVAALRGAGHRLWGINPKPVDRYRDRHTSSRAKSDSADALILANILRTDRHTLTTVFPRTATSPGASRCWPARIRTASGGAARRRTGCVTCSANTSLRRWWRSPT